VYSVTGSRMSNVNIQTKMAIGVIEIKSAYFVKEIIPAVNKVHASKI
jgi:hypothetical protein